MRGSANAGPLGPLRAVALDGGGPPSENPQVRIVRLGADLAERIGPRPYEVAGTSSIELAEGSGDAHAYVLYFEAGGVIGPHEAGFGQMLLALDGAGWVAGGDGERRPLTEGQAAFIERGEIHSKGSETGMTALMVQVRELTTTVGPSAVVE